MPKAKTRKVICAPKRNCGKHKIPKDVISIINKFKGLAFVACVNTPGFKPSNKKKGINVIGFDDVKNSYIVRVNVLDYEQKVYVRIKDEKKDNYKEAIENISY
ncbi:MAG: hypothetical protein QQN41_08020 [Nitrosopumilus sp.]